MEDGLDRGNLVIFGKYKLMGFELAPNVSKHKVLKQAWASEVLHLR